MTRRERATGPGLQVLFEFDRTRLAREGYDDDDSPRASVGRVTGTTGVMIRESETDVRRPPRVMPAHVGLGLKDVDEPLSSSHILVAVQFIDRRNTSEI